MKHTGTKFLLSATLVALFVTLGPRPAEAQTLGYWRFENDYTDSSGNGRTAVPNGAHTFSNNVAANAPGAFSLNNPGGTSVRVPNYAGPANNFTAELFFRGTQTSGTSFLMGTFDHTFGDSDSTGGWVVYLSNGRLAFDTGVQGTSAGTQSTIMSSLLYGDNQWHHVAVTLSSTNVMALYADGVLVNQIQGQLPAAARNDLLFGDTYSPASFPFSGGLDEVRLSQGVLNPSQFLLSSGSSAPEPGSLALLGLGLAGFIWKKKRENRKVLGSV